ncbi:glycosyltransferase [Actinoallomurus sp. CA-150999]|uniref:glycosyltransferase n=1 Tax=Actinoallomurus sp. CA-150999 TaxID=3239887 RepID=UPI003D8A0E6F
MQVANFYTPTSGGLRIALDELGRGYRQAGHERVLIVPGPAESVEQTPAGQRITVRGLSLPGLGDYRILTGRKRVLRLLDAMPPDVLEVSDKISLGWLARWSRRRGVPLVLFSHERLDAILLPRVPRWFPLRTAANIVNRRLSRLADRVIVTSAFSAAEFERIGAPSVRRIPLGVDLATFRPELEAPSCAATSTDPYGDRPELEAPPCAATSTDPYGDRPELEAPPCAATPADPYGDRPVRLVTVTRLSREKRPENAIDALAALRDQGVDASLVVIGDGPHRRRLRRRARGLPVTFLGHLSDRRAVAGLVAAADVALFPSPAETFGLATLEALACGTPVVVPPEGAARELLDGPGSGTVSDGTPSGMADAVRGLLSMPAARRRAAARAAAERYPWAETVAGLLRGYEVIGPADAEVSPSR